ncbi:hypothetical protein [Chroococcidiopsis sp. CCMEE 29]|uniref:hypothetical protein n=1 Tax=Chroococcidiopsis sp. CCMEE 29 TaxID=155894 RepID=UPI00202005DB|nr:hypothetical protein [Chroococcidiopsis sp. CCMEE 29]
MYNADDTWLYSTHYCDTAFCDTLPGCLTAIADMPVDVPYWQVAAASIECSLYGFYQTDLFWIAHVSKAATRA